MARGMSQPCMRLLALALGCLSPASLAEVLNLAELPMPASMTLSVHRVFYVYGGADAMAMSKKGEASTMEMNNLTIVPGPATNATVLETLQKPGKFQAGIVPYGHIFDFLGIYGNLCQQGELEFKSGDAQKEGLQKGILPKLKNALYPATASRVSEELPTGAYALVVANCADVTEGVTFGGKIAIKSPWGYLPVTQYYKETFYGVLAVVNSCVALAWIVFSLRWWRSLLAFQKGMAVVALVAVVEATLWWIFFATWNNSGDVDKVLFWVAQMASEGKLIAAMISVLSLQLLAEDVRPQDSCCEQADAVMPIGQHLVVTAFLVLEFNRAVTSHFRYSLAFKLSFVLANAAPAVLLGLFLWVCANNRLTSTLDELKKSNLEEKAKLLSRVQTLQLIALVLAVVICTLHLFDPTMSKEDPSLWKYHFCVSDGAAQVTFLLLLLAGMAVSLPSDNLQGPSYAPQQMDENVIGAPAVIWDDDDDLGESGERAGAAMGPAE